MAQGRVVMFGDVARELLRCYLATSGEKLPGSRGLAVSFLLQSQSVCWHHPKNPGTKLWLASLGEWGFSTASRPIPHATYGLLISHEQAWICIANGTLWTMVIGFFEDNQNCILS